MFPTAHPDLMGQLANERVERLHAEAADARQARRARRFLDQWRPARFVEPAADLHRVEVAAAAPARTGRAA
jgi:hypothetical protein